MKSSGVVPDYKFYCHIVEAYMASVTVGYVVQGQRADNSRGVIHDEAGMHVSAWSSPKRKRFCWWGGSEMVNKRFFFWPSSWTNSFLFSFLFFILF
jgi:hypothetical protein